MPQRELVERRKETRCRIDYKTQKFIIFWPLLASWLYLLVGFWPSAIFESQVNLFYQYSSMFVGVLGIGAVIFWNRPFLRNMMASIALGRSFAVIVYAIFAEPPLPFPTIMRLTAGTVTAILFFALAIAELPYLKAMSRGTE